MPSRSIKLQAGNGAASITAINCGISNSIKLGGSINLSSFVNLTDFTCVDNDITAISGYSDKTNLVNIKFNNNKVNHSIGDLSLLTKLKSFECFANQMTGSIPSLLKLTALNSFLCNDNRLSGSIPTDISSLKECIIFRCGNQTNSDPANINTGLTGSIPPLTALTNLEEFRCTLNKLSGSIPDLSSCTKLKIFQCDNMIGDNKINGAIPNLSSCTLLENFRCSINQITGSIPDLTGLNALTQFWCFSNAITGFSGSVPGSLGNFQAQNNNLTSTAVDSILAAFVTANGTPATRNINLSGALSLQNSAPSSVGVLKTTLVGSNFSRIGTTVTVNSTAHGYITGDYVTINGITETAFHGTFEITKKDDNSFTYTTITTGALVGTGNATLRKTSNGNTSGFRNYQKLTLVSRIGGPWTVAIRFPA